MKLTKSLALAVAALLMFGLYSCSKVDTGTSPLASSNNSAAIVSNTSASTYLANDVINYPGMVALASIVSSGTTETPFQLNPPPPPHGDTTYRGDTSHMRGGHMGDMGGKMGHMGDMKPDRGGFFAVGMIFRAMNLDSAQIAQIKVFTQQRNDCQQAQMKLLRDSEKPILDDANAKRAAILADLKAGTITADSARTALRALAQATKAALDANPVRAQVLQALKDCEDTYFANVRTILTADQQTLWDEFVALYKTLRDMKTGHIGG